MAKSTITRDKKALEAYKEKCRKIAESTQVNPLESEEDKNNRIAALKKDYKAMVKYYFPDYAESETPEFHVKHARRMLKNKRIRIWTKWPRGHAKSVVNNLLVPFFLWLNGEDVFLVIVGENAEKASLLLDDIRAEFESNQRIISDFGIQKTFGDWSETSFKTTSRFIGKSLGMGQSPRGIRVKNRRPNYISCDDWENEKTEGNPKAQKKLARWAIKSLMGTMDSGNRRFVVSQNEYADVMVFHFITQSNDTWIIDKVIAFDPATYESIAWPEKYDRQHWLDVVAEMTLVYALSEYNHEPYVEGKEFTDEMIQYIKIPKNLDAIIGIWDVAYSASATADFNAVRVWGAKNGNKYLIACFVKRSKMYGPLRWIADFQKTYSTSVLFKYESQFWNEELDNCIKTVESEEGITLNLIRMDRSTERKESRILNTLLAPYTNGRVYYNEDLKPNADHQEGVKQLKGIEPGYSGKDDAPDADQYAFKELDSYSSSSTAGYRIRKAENRKY